MSKKKVVIAGASGLVGYAAVRHFEAQPGCEIVALSRRAPPSPGRAKFVELDLNDPAACSRFAAEHADTTHFVYAAVQEQPSLIEGWRDEEQIARNDRMFRNLADPLVERAGGLKHVLLMQGLKAYGAHVKQPDIPEREHRSEMVSQPNFYWKQQDHLFELRRKGSWSWTILRPANIFGMALASSLNPIPAIGVYAALQKARGEPMDFPGGEIRIIQAIDVDVLANCIGWAGEAEAARDQIFNISNGDVFTWKEVWPAVCDALGVAPGEHKPTSMGETMPARAAEWDAVRKSHGLASPGMMEFVGKSFQYLDYTFCLGRTEWGASIGSNIRLRQAGFHEQVDTEDMFRKWFRIFQDRKLLPPR